MRFGTHGPIIRLVKKDVYKRQIHFARLNFLFDISLCLHTLVRRGGRSYAAYAMWCTILTKKHCFHKIFYVKYTVPESETPLETPPSDDIVTPCTIKTDINIQKSQNKQGISSTIDKRHYAKIRYVMIQ